jgi:hypothetical protein
MQIEAYIHLELALGHVATISGSGWGPVEGSSECSNEPSGSIICGEALEWLRDW